MNIMFLELRKSVEGQYLGGEPTSWGGPEDFIDIYLAVRKVEMGTGTVCYHFTVKQILKTPVISLK